MIVSTLTIYIIVALAAALLAVVIVVITAIRITRALAKGVRFANQIALGDLNVELDFHQSDEIGQLADSLRTLEEISSSLNEINSQSNQNAENASEATAVAKSAAEKAVSGIGTNKRLGPESTVRASQLSQMK